jgi:hypothetical protein
MIVFTERFLVDFAQRSESNAEQQIHSHTYTQLPKPNSSAHSPNSFPELKSHVRDAAQGGFRAFPVLTGSLHTPKAKQLIQEATSCARRLEELAATYPGAEYGLAMGAGFIAIQMNGDSGVQEFNALAGIEFLCNDDNTWDWQTRLFHWRSTTWAVFRCPDVPARMHVRGLGGDLAIVGDGGWIPCPGSTFHSATCSEVNPEVPIAQAPPFLLKRAFDLPDEV